MEVLRRYKDHVLIADPVYGHFEITEPVLVALLSDPTVERVGKIMQGATTSLLTGWREFSRLEHCIGTMLIVRMVGGDVEAQIAALLHDVSHTVFSHVVDFVYGKESSQDYHEEIKHLLLNQSSIPALLDAYGYSYERIFDDSFFPLHELPSPDLCADRLDYSLRALSYYFGKTAQSYRYFHALIRHGNEIIFNNMEDAINFTRDFLFLDQNVFANVRNLASYYVLADALKFGLSRKILCEADFLLTDDVVWQKLINAGDDEILQLLTLLNQNFKVTVVDDCGDYCMFTKARWVNPKFFYNGSIVRVFDVDPDLKNEVTMHIERCQRPVCVKVF